MSSKQNTKAKDMINAISDICKKICKDMLKEKNVESISYATITAVNANDRYDVMVVGGTDEYKNLLNKSVSTPLSVGDNVILRYVQGNIGNGYISEKMGVDNRGGSSSSGVTSVNGETGAVTLSLGDIDSVALTSPTSGQVLMYNGTNWVNTTIGDYVIEQGTNGIWTYKKWLNGGIEIRGTYVTAQSYAITSAYGGIYRYASRFNVSIPFSLVDYSTDSQVSISIKGSGLDFAGAVYMYDANTPSFFWCNPTSYTCAAGAKIQCYVVGKWK